MIPILCKLQGDFVVTFNRLDTVSGGDQEARTVSLLVWVVVVFVLAWLPLNTLNVLLDLGFYPTLFRCPYTLLRLTSHCH